MSRMRGRYPGGPSRRTDPETPPPQRGKVHLSTVEEIEARAAAASQKRRQQTRRRQIFVGLLLSLAVALILGGYLGFSSHRTGEELASEMEGAQEQVEKSDMDRQMDRLIDEMWKTEALEKGPGGRR